MNNHCTAVLYDVELIACDTRVNRVRFRHQQCGLSLPAPERLAWPIGSVGRLTLYEDGSFGFLAYVDPRMRRSEGFDEPRTGRWGWRIGDYHLQVKAGVIPGLNGCVVREDVIPLIIAVPREFRQLCTAYAVTPEQALRAFIADVCALHSFVINPREDGYSSSGSDERLLAREYWLRTYHEPRF